MENGTYTFPIRSDKLTMTVKVSQELADVRSEFQRIQVLDTEVFGRILLLDGHIQLSELDEKAYHESLVHIPLAAVPEPRRALVVGGGDGGVIRELCRYPTITRIDMVEIDAKVVEVSREHLPTVSNGAFDDPRVHLQIADAFPYVKGDLEPYDLIVIDATDTYEDEEGEISESLFTDAFYADCLRILSPNGFVVTQADNLLFCPYSLEEIEANFRRTFPFVGHYWGMVPSFGGFSGYVWAGHGPLQPTEPQLPGLRYLDPSKFALAFSPLQF